MSDACGFFGEAPVAGSTLSARTAMCVDYYSRQDCVTVRAVQKKETLNDDFIKRCACATINTYGLFLYG